MRRDTFLKSLAALAATWRLPLVRAGGGQPEDDDPGQPRRRLGHHRPCTGQGAAGSRRRQRRDLREQGRRRRRDRPGAVRQRAARATANALMVMGAVMLGGIITNKPPVSVTQVTPIARLTSEYNVFVLPADSPFKTMKDVVDAVQEGPGQRQVGRRLARLDRAHRDRDDGARGRRRPDRRSTTCPSAAAARPRRPSSAATSASAAAATASSSPTSRRARCAPSASPPSRGRPASWCRR